MIFLLIFVWPPSSFTSRERVQYTLFVQILTAGSPIPSYPTVCTYHQYTGGRHCKQLLTRPHCIEGKEVHVPIKTFASFDFKDWVAGLLSRAELKKYMDAAWDTAAAHGGLGNMHDIFDGKVL